MDKATQDLFAALKAPDAEMINDANIALAQLGKKWKLEQKLGPASMAAILIVVFKKYVDIGLPAEAIPMVTSVAWGVANTLKWKAGEDA